MNKYPAWLNTLVVIVLIAGCLLALPNIYGSVPAIQLADNDGTAYDDTQLQEFVQAAENFGVAPEAAYLKDGRAVLRFDADVELATIGQEMRSRYGRNASIAQTLTPKLPDWVRDLGLSPMSLGLDLRGGVYVLLEVDMDQAVQSRLQSYEQDFSDRLRSAKISRHRVDLDGQTIRVRLTSTEDMLAARDVIQRADPDIFIADGADGKSLSVRMSEAQIKARRDFAIDQNVTTLRSRVNQLGVAEPLVQRQGEDRIVLQLPGVDDPNKISEIITATATIEFRMVDLSGD
jgi:preprotein translocase subunit SecD